MSINGQSSKISIAAVHTSITEICDWLKALRNKKTGSNSNANLSFSPPFKSSLLFSLFFQKSHPPLMTKQGIRVCCFFLTLRISLLPNKFAAKAEALSCKWLSLRETFHIFQFFQTMQNPFFISLVLCWILVKFVSFVSFCQVLCLHCLCRFQVFHFIGRMLCLPGMWTC
jgi:hypothetical protein